MTINNIDNCKNEANNHLQYLDFISTEMEISFPNEIKKYGKITTTN